MGQFSQARPFMPTDLFSAENLLHGRVVPECSHVLPAHTHGVYGVVRVGCINSSITNEGPEGTLLVGHAQAIGWGFSEWAMPPSAALDGDFGLRFLVGRRSR